MARSASQALLLDFDGVITKTLFERRDDLEQACGLPRDTLTWRGPFSPDDDPLWVEMGRGRISEADYWRNRAAELSSLTRKTETLTTMYARLVGHGLAGHVRIEALTLIAAAMRAGRKVGVLANDLELNHGPDATTELPFRDHLHCIIDSTHEPVAKPNPHAYRLAVEALALRPETVVYLDDNPRFVAAARHYGMQAIQFDITRPAEGFLAAAEALELPEAQLDQTG